MILHPEIARWMVLAEHERLAELAARPRPGTVRRHQRSRHRDRGA